MGKAELIHGKSGPGSQASSLQAAGIAILCPLQTRGVLGAVEPQESREFPGQGTN